MAKPSTASAFATITNPSLALTDFTLIVDLSLLPTTTQADWNSNDGGRGRAYKQGTETELSCDFIDLDYVNGTGLLRVQWSGTLASTGTQQVQIFLPNTGNSLYGVNDIYGQYNAYDSNWLHYYPFFEDPTGISPQFKDRVSGGYDLESNNMTSLNSVDGKMGRAIKIMGSLGETVQSPSADFPQSDLNNNFTVICCINTIDDGVFGSVWGFRDGGRFVMQTAVSGSLTRVQSSNASVNFYSNPSMTIGNDYQLTLKRDGSDFTSYIDNDSQTEIYNPAIQTDTTFQMGLQGAFDHYDGIISGLHFHSTVRSDAFIEEEQSQIDDNATFWGAWTDVPVSSESATPDDIILSAIDLDSTTAYKTAVPSDLTLSQIILESTSASTTAKLDDLILNDIILGNATAKSTAILNDLILNNIILSETTGRALGTAKPTNLRLSSIILRQTKQSGGIATPICITIKMSSAATTINNSVATTTINMEVC